MSLIKTTSIVKPGTYMTDFSGAAFTVDTVGADSVLVRFGTKMPTEQCLRAPDLRELADLFEELADVLEYGREGYVDGEFQCSIGSCSDDSEGIE